MKEYEEGLLSSSGNPEIVKTPYPSTARQRGMLATILFLLFVSLCADTMLFPFFPKIAVEKGLSSIQIGAVFSSYELARFVFSPVFGSLVSKIL